MLLLVVVWVSVGMVRYGLVRVLDGARRVLT